MADPARTLDHWAGLLKPGGRLVLIEGVWGGTGLSAARLAGLLTAHGMSVRHERLSGDARLWGREVHDERYALVARALPTPAAR